MRVVRYILPLVLLLGLGSCGVAVRKCQSPELNLPESIILGELDSLSLADVEWWEFYGDETLAKFINQALESNKDLLAAASKVEQLRAQRRVTRSAWSPTLGLSAYGDNEVENYTDKGNTETPQYDLKANLGWEIDLWGNVLWASRKASAEYLASVEAERAMRMTVMSEVATTYYQLLALENELNIINRALKTREVGIEQARVRFEGGITSEMVYQQAEVEYAATAALIPALKTKIETTKNSLRVLLGEYPDFELEYSKLRIKDRYVYTELPVGLPSDLLMRRPDLREAEQKLKAACAAVGVAYTDRFPKLVVGLTLGHENGELMSLLTAPYGLLVGKLAAPIFEFGRRKAKYKAAIYAYDVARLGYEKRVLNAFREVNDAVVRYRNACEATKLKDNLLAAAEQYEILATIQHQFGDTKYINVLDAQRRYLDAQIGLSNAVRDEYIALVQLYKALGGGWRVSE